MRRARLEDNDGRLTRASGCVAVEVLVQFTPALPQPFRGRHLFASDEELVAGLDV